MHSFFSFHSPIPIGLSQGNIIEIVVFLFTFVYLLINGVIDYRYRIIPNSLIIVGIAFAFAIMGFRFTVNDYSPLISILGSMIGGIAVGGTLLIFSLAIKNSIGMGDVKLFFCYWPYLWIC